jgi:adenylate cyclase
MKEIERKFLIKGDYKPFISESFIIKQGYLSSVPERTVRIRVMDNSAFITVKGIADKNGITRIEWEKEIEKSEAAELLALCEPGIIEKKRSLISFAGHIFEVDEFYGVNKGLIIAEIELQEEDEKFEKPSWLGEEVSGDKRYYNSMLTKNPFTKWGSG